MQEVSRMSQATGGHMSLKFYSFHHAICLIVIEDETVKDSGMFEEGTSNLFDLNTKPT